MRAADLQVTPFANVLSGIEAFRPSATGEGLSSPRVRALNGWWHGFLASRGHVPTRRDFDPLDHAPILPWVYLIRVRPGPILEFALNGEEVKQLIGRNTTGETAGTGRPGAFGHDLVRYYREALESHRVTACRGTLAFAGRGHRRFESLDCPLLGPDGTVSHIVGVMDAAGDAAGP
jgi:hypothetical protein